MNDDELRDHLRSTLEPVSSPTPELARLRRLARRRRQRRQFTAGALGLALIAGAGFGIAEATNGHSGRATVTAGQSPSTAPADVTTPCQAARVSLQVGQTLHVAPCPDVSGHTVGAAPATGTALSQTGRSTFHADERGTSTLQIEYIGCAGPPLTSCLSDQRIIGTILVTVGPTYLKGPPPEPVPCQGGPVSVLVGQHFDLTNCPVGLQSTIDDPSVLASAGAPSAFTGLRAGTTHVELYVKPECSPGTMCPKYVRDLGTLVVTVTTSAAPGVVVTQCRTGAITVQAGQRLKVAGCPTEVSVVVSGPDLVGPTGATTSGLLFQAVGPDRDVISISRPMCAALPAAQRDTCAGGVAQVATITVTITAE